MTGRMTRRRYRGARRVVASLHAAAIALMLWAVPAAAVNVTVAATTYDISFAGFGRTFLDDETAIRATPWWGNETLATAVANAYLDQVGVGGSPFTDDMRQNTTLNFAYAIGNVGGFDVVRFSQLTEGSPPLITTGGFQEQDIATSFSVFAILGAPAVPVPEINARALAQALFCLMALQLWIVLRRRRVHAQQGRRVQP